MGSQASGSQASGSVMSPQHDYPPRKRQRRDPLDDWSAAQVLTSFNKFPIKTTNQQTQSQANDSMDVPNSGGEQRLDPTMTDPLYADINAASQTSETVDLPTALAPSVRVSLGAEKPSGLSNCPGVTGIGGPMVPGGAPKPQYDRIPRMPSVGTPATPKNGQISPNGSGTRRSSNGVTKPSSSKDGAFKTTFQFVVNEDAKEARNTVRKHVMREYRRRERWEQGLKTEEDAEGDNAGPATGKRRRKRSRPTSDSDPSTSREAAISSSTSESGELGEVGSKGKQPWIEPGAKRRRVGVGGVNGEAPAQLWGLADEAEEAITELGGVHMLPYQADPWAEIAVSDIDPFSKLRMQLGPATQSLLHHCEPNLPRLLLRETFGADAMNSCVGDAKPDGRDRDRQCVPAAGLAVRQRGRP